MRTVCIDGPITGQVVESDSSSFKVPVRGASNLLFEQGGSDTIPVIVTTEYRRVWIDGQKAYDVVDAGFENAGIGDWSTARMAVRKGVYDVYKRCFAVWSCK